MSRFTITIDRKNCRETMFSKDPESVDGNEAMIELVEAYIRAHESKFRNKIHKLVTVYINVRIEDRDGECAYKDIYVQPDEPKDADGDWIFRGGSDDEKYYSCGSIKGRKDWWKVVDTSAANYIETDGWDGITYSQEPPAWYE